MKFIIFTALLSLYSSLAFSWGKIGHEASAILATQALSPKAKLKVQALLGSGNLMDASTWSDSIRSQGPWQHTKTFHYTQVQDSSDYYSSLKGLNLEQKAAGDLLRALVKSEDVLRDSKTSQEQKTHALKFLVHFVGDLHQPLRTGRPEDLGGNQVELSWFGKPNNLHSVWDSGIIQARLGVVEASEDYVKQMKKPTPAEISRWQKGSYLEWHNESLKDRPNSYGSAQLGNQEVVDKYQGYVEERIKAAGLRLAFVLNSIFEDRPLTLEGTALRKKLATLLGPEHSADIILMPKESAVPLSPSASPYECSHE